MSSNGDVDANACSGGIFDGIAWFSASGSSLIDQKKNHRMDYDKFGCKMYAGLQQRSPYNHQTYP